MPRRCPWDAETAAHGADVTSGTRNECHLYIFHGFAVQANDGRRPDVSSAPHHCDAQLQPDYFRNNTGSYVARRQLCSLLHILFVVGVFLSICVFSCFIFVSMCV